MCMCLWGSRGACMRGGNKDYCPASFCRRLWILFDSFSVERGETKTRAKAPLFHPLPFCWGRENQPFWSLCSSWVWALCQCRGAEGGQAGSVNAYHDHNRAKEHGSAMKAQRERLRIPGLTLEWVFSSVTVRAAAPLQRVASLTSLSYLWLSFTVALSSVQR